jgi:hypothetical protein
MDRRERVIETYGSKVGFRSLISRSMRVAAHTILDHFVLIPIRPDEPL